MCSAAPPNAIGRVSGLAVVHGSRVRAAAMDETMKARAGRATDHPGFNNT